MNKEITKCKEAFVENRIEKQWHDTKVKNSDKGVNRQKDKIGRRTKRDFEKFES